MHTGWYMKWHFGNIFCRFSRISNKQIADVGPTLYKGVHDLHIFGNIANLKFWDFGVCIDSAQFRHTPNYLKHPDSGF